MEKVERVDRILKYQGTIVDVFDDIMRLPNGAKEHWDYIEHRKGAAAVLPVLDDGRIALVRQYRNALDQETLEIPAGARDSRQEPTDVCAAREMEEEIGYRAGKLEKLLTVATTGAFCNESIDIYLATELIKTSQHLDEEEFLEVEVYEVDELCRMIFSGDIIDAKTVAAILAYKAKAAE